MKRSVGRTPCPFLYREGGSGGASGPEDGEAAEPGVVRDQGVAAGDARARQASDVDPVFPLRVPAPPAAVAAQRVVSVEAPSGFEPE
ncbi:MAG: hypothetical protein ACE5JR_10325 [Gemmatimonadota bacterium]